MRHTARKFLSILLALVIVNGLLPASEIMAMTEDFAEVPAIELNMDEGLHPKTWACYSSRNYSANHGCCIVGWDDNYPAENFKQMPPADGAWLVKNSWGSETDVVPDALVSQDGTARPAITCIRSVNPNAKH